MCTPGAHRAGGTHWLGKLDHRDGLASFVLSLSPALRALALRTDRHLLGPIQLEILRRKAAWLPSGGASHRSDDARAQAGLFDQLLGAGIANIQIHLLGSQALLAL